MKLFHLTEGNHGLLNLALRRIKVARIADLNDPFELMPFNVRNKALRQVLRNHRDHFNNERGILCFSPNWGDPVMWAHYGDKHKGMALGFDVPDSLPAKIQYSPTLLDYEIGDLSDEQVTQKLFITKYSGWSYENEFRLFVDLKECEQEGGLYFARFDDNLRLNEVVLGERSKTTIPRVEELLSSYLSPVYVRKARCAFTKYGVTENKYRVEGEP